MRNKLYIKTRLNDVLANMTHQNEQQTARQTAQVQAYMWLYNNGELRREEEINIMIQNCLDELTAFERMGIKTPMKLRPVEDKLRIFRDTLKDEKAL